MSAPRRTALSAVLLLLAAACSEAPKQEAKKAETAKPPEPVTGLKAFFQMYTAARTWAADLQPLTCISAPLKEIPAQDGKYPVWRCTFVSESKKSSKTYTYSIVTGDGLNKGIYGGTEESYSGPRGQNAPFPMQALKKDTDEALKVAMKRGEEYAKKNPNKPIIFMIEKTKEIQNPAWRVIWGESVGTSNFSIYVDASTGEYVKTMR